MPRKAVTESISDANSAPGGVAAVDRALSLLAAFHAGDKALSLTEMAERTGLYKSTALRLLASLEHARLIQRLDDGPYRGCWALGSEVARLQSLYAASFSLEGVVLPVLRELVVLTGESAAYHVRQGDARLCLYRVDSPNPIRDHIKAGDLLSPDRGAGARILRAFSAPEPGEAGKPDSADIAKIRAQGYCAIVGDRVAEIAGISAPVFKIDGSLAGALTLTCPSSRFDEGHITHVVTSARKLSGLI
jgi:DNA-binding IclR family transcriptional regulator